MAPTVARVPQIVQRDAAFERPTLGAGYRKAPPEPRLVLDKVVSQSVLRVSVQTPRGDTRSVVTGHYQQLTIMQPGAALLHGADQPRAGLDHHYLAQGRLALQPEGLSSRALALHHFVHAFARVMAQAQVVVGLARPCASTSSHGRP